MRLSGGKRGTRWGNQPRHTSIGSHHGLAGGRADQDGSFVGAIAGGACYRGCRLLGVSPAVDRRALLSFQKLGQLLIAVGKGETGVSLTAGG
jgi:hypothetical protein